MLLRCAPSACRSDRCARPLAHPRTHSDRDALAFSIASHRTHAPTTRRRRLVDRLCRCRRFPQLLSSLVPRSTLLAILLLNLPPTCACAQQLLFAFFTCSHSTADRRSSAQGRASHSANTTTSSSSPSCSCGRWRGLTHASRAGSLVSIPQKRLTGRRGTTIYGSPPVAPCLVHHLAVELASTASTGLIIFCASQNSCPMQSCRLPQ